MQNFKAGLVLMLMTGQCLALESDRTQKIIMDGPGCVVNLKQQQTQCKNGLNIKQGTMLIKSGHAVIHHKDNEVSKVVMQGTPVYFEQLIEADEDKMVITARNMDYRKPLGKIFLSGNVKIISSVGVTTGEEIEFDINRQEIIATGQTEDQQFHMEIDPNND